MLGDRDPAEFACAMDLQRLLHGFGADGNDLIDIGRQRQALLPDTAFVSPHAPEPCAGAPHGRQWFGLTFRDPGERWRGVAQARPLLDRFLDDELARHSLEAGDMALVGFSQGTMMALHAGLRRRPALAGIVGYSGILVTPPGKDPAALTLPADPPPVLLVHGDQDQVIPPPALAFSVEELKALNVPVGSHLSRGVGHGIDATGLRLGGEFLVTIFRKAA